jgi:hypothetical protein
MLFADARAQFFRPLTSKYRAQIAECLRVLYERLYSANADYGQSLRRDQMLEVFAEALARAPVLEGDDDGETRFRNHREQAVWVLNTLMEHGWIEKQVDQATLDSTFPFTRLGRLFTQPLVEADVTRVRTRHRNTRNTLNALEAFLQRGEIHDLLDAYEYSERIIADFADIIGELEERKRALVREVESQLLVQQATQDFFDFMEKRFQPDVAVRLSADSVEKHRDAINAVIARIRRQRKEFKADAEARLRQVVPELVQPGRSVLWTVLDTIETRMRRAAETMLPALRRALQGFTKRADIIMRQLSYLGSQRHSDVLRLCQSLSRLPPAEADHLLAQAGHRMAGVQCELVDPAQVRLTTRRRQEEVQTLVEEDGATLSSESRREAFVQMALDQAFVVSDDQLRRYIFSTLAGGRSIRTDELPVRNAPDLLAMAHAIELGAHRNLDSRLRFRVTRLGDETASHEFYDRLDRFEIELVDEPPPETPA